MFAVIATFLLFLSVSRSAPLTCEDLVRPQDELDCRHLEGTWTLLLASISLPDTREAMKIRDSITMDFSHAYWNTTSYTQANRIAGRCQYLSYNISVEGGRFTFHAGGCFNLSGAFLRTSSCPECLVMRWDVRWDVEATRRTSVDLYLLSRRRRAVTPEEYEEYLAQLNCLGLPPPIVMDPTKELCPEQSQQGRAETQTEAQ